MQWICIGELLKAYLGLPASYKLLLSCELPVRKLVASRRLEVAVEQLFVWSCAWLVLAQNQIPQLQQQL